MAAAESETPISETSTSETSTSETPISETSTSETPTSKPQKSGSGRHAQHDAAADLDSKPTLGFWAVFASTFVTIAIAEMGDKTQVATLLLSAESHHPLVVFVGAGMALITTSLFGVLLGTWLSSKLLPRWIERGAAITLLFLSASLFWEILTGK